MSKRFTDTEIWEQDWYIDLPNKYKLLWNYIKDKCDNVGIWRPNKSVLQKIITEPLSLDDFLSFLNIEKERIRVLPTGRWWVKDFFIFQYGNKFSPTSPVHKGALKILVQNGIHINEIFNDGIGNLQVIDFQQLKEIAYSKDINTLNVAFGNPSIRVKDKDKDKEYIEPIINNYSIEQKIKKQEDMIVIEMVKVWKKHNPNYLEDKEYDYTACLQMAYKIAKVKGWKEADVIDFKELAVIESWKKIMDFIVTDGFLKNLPLKNLNNQFQMVVQKMQSQSAASVKVESPMRRRKAGELIQWASEEEKQRAMEEWANS